MFNLDLACSPVLPSSEFLIFAGGDGVVCVCVQAVTCGIAAAHIAASAHTGACVRMSATEDPCLDAGAAAAIAAAAKRLTSTGPAISSGLQSHSGVSSG